MFGMYLPLSSPKATMRLLTQGAPRISVRSLTSSVFGARAVTIIRCQRLPKETKEQGHSDEPAAKKAKSSLPVCRYVETKDLTTALVDDNGRK